jgi:hypothetical protein
VVDWQPAVAYLHVAWNLSWSHLLKPVLLYLE